MIKDSKSRRILSHEDKPISIFELSLSNLEHILVEIGQPKYRARQIWRAVYAEGRSSFDEMTNVSKQLKIVLPKTIAIDLLVPKLYSTSKDRSTDKALFPLSDGELIETVLMRYTADGHRRRRKTVCISTQAGCALGCTFCATGQQGFSRNLSVGEIVKQVLYMEKVARREDMLDIENGNRTIGELQGITNVVHQLFDYRSQCQAYPPCVLPFPYTTPASQFHQQKDYD
jgi:23S rRNA (adenine2503-C2)-methyltransferase